MDEISIDQIIEELDFEKFYLKKGGMLEQDLGTAKDIYRKVFSDKKKLNILNKEGVNDQRLSKFFEIANYLDIILFDPNENCYKYKEKRPQSSLPEVLITHPMQQREEGKSYTIS